MVAPLQSLGGLDRVQRGQDRLDGQAAAGRQLPAGPAQCRGHGRGPAVLPDQDRGRGAWLQDGGGLLQVLEVQQARGGAFELGERRGHLLEVAQLEPTHRPVLVLGHERDVQDADDALAHQVQQQRLDLAGVGVRTRPHQDRVVDRA
jgi:hypothetical protein